MWLPRALRYLWYTCRHPSLNDFISQGLGIEVRASRYAQWWERHLNLSRSFQKRALEGDCGQSALILGSGRLYDVPFEFISERFSKVTLVDRDPSAEIGIAKLRRYAPEAKLSFLCIEVTGTIDRWSDELRRLGSKEDLPSFLNLLSATPPKLPQHDVVISLNLLSQLSLYWRDRFSEIVKDKWKIESDDDGSFGNEIDGALMKSYEALERSHIDQLRESEARRIVLIADRYFHFYRRDVASWRTERATRVRDIEESLVGYDTTLRDSWFWHLRPAGSEGLDYGEIHEVGALGFEASALRASVSLP